MIDCIVRNYLSLSLCFVKYATCWKYFHIKVADVFTSGISHTCRNHELYCSPRETDPVIVNTTLLLYMLHSFITCSGFSCWPSSSHVEVYSVSWSYWPEDSIIVTLQNIAHLKLSNNKFSSAEKYTSITEKVTLGIKIHHIQFCICCKSFKHASIWEEFFFITYAIMY